MRQQALAAAARRNLIFGTNTDVGKTLVSTGLTRAAVVATAGAINNNNNRGGGGNSYKKTVQYIKPLQCGGSDEDFVRRHLKDISAAAADCVDFQTVFRWELAASPHLCSKVEGLNNYTDEKVISKVQTLLQNFEDYHNNSNTTRPAADATLTNKVSLIETAGGVLSPSAATNNELKWHTQGDLYKSLRVPVVLVGDSKLGGIHATLSSLESLTIRGYDIHGIVFVNADDGAQNENADAVRDYLLTNSDIVKDDDVFTVMCPPADETVPLFSWYNSEAVTRSFQTINNHLTRKHIEQLDRLDYLSKRGEKVLWWPFTQHQTIEDFSVVDAAVGDYFLTLPKQQNFLNDEKSANDSSSLNNRVRMYDASCSWWTQGVGHGNTSIALATAAAAGRYGHILFPNIVHEPAVRVSELLLKEYCPWAHRVFFSDDGSTAVEVALKMGFRTFAERHLKSSNRSNISGDNDCAPFTEGLELGVLAQEDAYHGDTLGVMNVALPSIFNEAQHPWFESKGVFLSTPVLGYDDGQFKVDIPYDFDYYSSSEEQIVFENTSAAMDIDSRLANQQDVYDCYTRYIQSKWNDYENNAGINGNNCKRLIGSIIIEPVLMGAGGMKFVDPLFQRAMMDEGRRRDVPIIFDEIFAGLYRLGYKACNEILRADPDISCYAKLLTGGLMPLAVTVANKDVFETFLSDNKAQALLHGHSYTANPMGCAAAVHSLERYQKEMALQNDTGGNRTKFDENIVRSLSKLPIVASSFAIGNVVAVRLQGQKGYGASEAAKSLLIRELPCYIRKVS